MISRRTFWARAVAAGLALGTSIPLSATSAARPRGPLGRPVGLQLYTVREQAAADLDGTLEVIAGLGYEEVETAGFYGRSAAEFSERLAHHGLRATAAHVSLFELLADVDAKLEETLAIGAGYLVCSFPAAPEPERLGASPTEVGGAIFRGGLTLDEWRWNAEQLDRIGEAATRAGLRFAYHNHAMEFAAYAGTVAFDEILRLTDPERVHLEVDCAWVVAGGREPAEFIRAHRPRVRLLHLKDVKADAESFTTVPLGRGVIDWPSVFAAVDDERLDHYFVEQEHFEQPPLEAVAESILYLTGISGETA